MSAVVRLNVPRPQLWVFDPAESPRERHRRRLATAQAHRAAVAAWCAYRGVAFTVVDADCAWRFTSSDHFARWYPCAGKFGCKRALRSGPHYRAKIYDTGQLLIVLAWWLSDALHLSEV